LLIQGLLGTSANVEFEGTHRFSVVRRLGESGMGVVYVVLDREKNAAVALKLLRKWAPDAILRFKAEFRALQEISHENLFSLGELFEEQGQWFFSMELVLGDDFLSFIGARAIESEPPTDARQSSSASLEQMRTPNLFRMPGFSSPF
jgi:serine/threonine protein kinase